MLKEKISYIPIYRNYIKKLSISTNNAQNQQKRLIELISDKYAKISGGIIKMKIEITNCIIFIVKIFSWLTTSVSEGDIIEDNKNPKIEEKNTIQKNTNILYDEDLYCKMPLRFIRFLFL